MGLAAALPGSPDGGLSMRTGTVTAISAGVISVDIGGGTLLAASYLDSYFPALGDVVQLIGASGAWLIIGRCGTTPGQLSIRDADTGLSQVEMGLLDDGTYGLAAINGPGQLVDLAALATVQATTSTTYTDLATVGPARTAPVGTTGKALVMLSSTIISAVGGNTAAMSVAISGASTVAASDAYCLLAQASGGSYTFSLSRAVLFTGLTAGSNTFTAKYRVSSGTATFLSRDIAVFPY